MQTNNTLDLTADGSNYATSSPVLRPWKLFDGFDVQDAYPVEVAENDAYGLSLQRKNAATTLFAIHSTDSRLFAVDYARAFLQDVNFYEIATHLLNDIKAEA
jgi:hypothetical protein